MKRIPKLKTRIPWLATYSPQQVPPILLHIFVIFQVNRMPYQKNMCINASIGVASKKECERNGKNLQLPVQKGLSVTSVASSQRSNGNDMFPIHPPTSVSSSRDCAMQPSDAAAENSLARSIGGPSDSFNKPLGGNRRIIRTLGLKLSLKSVKSEKKSDDQKENMVPNHMPSHSSFNNLQKRPMEDVSVKNFDEAATPIPLNSGTKNQQPNSQLLSNNNPNECHKKLCLLSKRLSLKPKLHETDKICIWRDSTSQSNHKTQVIWKGGEALLSRSNIPPPVYQSGSIHTWGQLGLSVCARTVR
jgi:hypothetical protein